MRNVGISVIRTPRNFRDQRGPDNRGSTVLMANAPKPETVNMLSGYRGLQMHGSRGSTNYPSRKTIYTAADTLPFPRFLL